MLKRFTHILVFFVFLAFSSNLYGKDSEPKETKPTNIVDSISITTDPNDKSKKLLNVVFYNGKTIKIELSREQLDSIMSSEEELKKLSRQIFLMFLE